MRILFLENRQKTYLWEHVALRLQADGHDITWVIQNHGFKPNLEVGKVVAIPYPTALQLSQQSSADLNFIRSSDRNINYFKGNDRHYRYYDEAIHRILRDEAPDIVFGEGTLFHELLFIRNCRQMGIPYLNPSTCRYPTGRFSFYEFDTLEPFQGSKECLPRTEVASIIERISNRSVQPDYMQQKRRNTRAQLIFEKLRLTRHYLLGERFNTPSPVIKNALERRLHNDKSNWESFALKEVPTNDRFKILYALQMQPEANLDVWGNRYRNQSKLLRSLAQHTDSQTEILVKPNPKSKYELFDLLGCIRSTERLLPLSHCLSMGPVFSQADLVVAVTGTVAIEAILCGKPVVSLIRTLNNNANGCVYLENLDNLPAIVDSVRKGEFPLMSLDERIDFLQLLCKTSYRGRIADPFNDPSSIDAENIDHLHAAFSDVLSALSSGDWTTVRPIP